MFAGYIHYLWRVANTVEAFGFTSSKASLYAMQKLQITYAFFGGGQAQITRLCADHHNHFFLGSAQWHKL